MRYLVLSDIHANALALEAVLEHARKRRWDKAIVLGDLVGYYTEPERVVRMISDLQPEVKILGNHDALVLSAVDGAPMGDREDSVVLDVISRHAEALSDDSIAFLRSLADHHLDDGWEATHGALRSQWEYLATLQSAQANAPLLRSRLCMVGHTHVPRIFASVATPAGDLWRTMPFRSDRSLYRIPPRATLFFNPGSVGQPRDGIPLASYGIFDAGVGSLEVFRVEFDLLGTQRLVRSAGYPEALASRLAVGK